jgi:hypothetical protein
MHQKEYSASSPTFAQHAGIPKAYTRWRRTKTDAISTAWMKSTAKIVGRHSGRSGLAVNPKGGAVPKSAPCPSREGTV